MTLLSISKFRALLHEMAMPAMVQRLCIDIQKAIPRQSGGISADIRNRLKPVQVTLLFFRPELSQRYLPCPRGFRHGFKEGGLKDRLAFSRSINFPLPRLGLTTPVLNGEGVVGWVEG
jgi:hypothetical protein